VGVSVILYKVLLQPLGDKELEQARHVNEERQHALASRLVRGTARFEKEAAQGVKREVVGVQPVVPPTHAFQGAELAHRDGASQGMVGHAKARQSALRTDARHEYQVEHPWQDLIVLEIGGVLLENTGQSNAVWPRECLASSPSGNAGRSCPRS
jgi:hypothetical protein